MSYRTDRVTLDGRTTTRRTRDMVLQAEAEFYVRTGRLRPKASQGGYNAGGVAASAGTHDRDALDFATAGFSDTLNKEWELALWKVGGASWWRRHREGVWPEHNHMIPKNGDLSAGAEKQERAFRNKRDGLVSNLSYPRIGIYANRTWEGFQSIRKPDAGKKFKILVSGGSPVYLDEPDYISVYWCNIARANKSRSSHIYTMQIWLARIGYYKGPKTGKWDTATQKAFDDFRRLKLKWPAADNTGKVGISSLHYLRLYAKSLRIVKER